MTYYYIPFLPITRPISLLSPAASTLTPVITSITRVATYPTLLVHALTWGCSDQYLLSRLTVRVRTSPAGPSADKLVEGRTMIFQIVRQEIRYHTSNASATFVQCTSTVQVYAPQQLPYSTVPDCTLVISSSAQHGRTNQKWRPRIRSASSASAREVGCGLMRPSSGGGPKRLQRSTLLSRRVGIYQPAN